MTPKEKARELFNKYATYVVMWKGDINTTHQNCKQCALIAVDEILLIAPMMHMEGFGNLTIREYYKKVKQEIEKL
jgi:hypothetical protein